MPIEPAVGLEIKWIKGKGRGVFATQPFEIGDLIEAVPMLLIPMASFQQNQYMQKLESYCFLWNDDHLGLALGYGSLYNHSFKPNAIYFDKGKMKKEIYAMKPIEIGEEITFNYNGDPDDQTRMDFDVLD